MSDPRRERGWANPNSPVVYSEEERAGQRDRLRVEAMGGHGAGALLLIPMAVFAWQGIVQFAQTATGATIGSTLFAALAAALIAALVWIVAAVLQRRPTVDNGSGRLLRRMVLVGVISALMTQATALGAIFSAAQNATSGVAGDFDFIGRGVATLIAWLRDVHDLRISDKAWEMTVETTGAFGTAAALVLLLLPIAMYAAMLFRWLTTVRAFVVATLAHGASAYVVVYFAGFLMNDYLIRIV